MIRDYLEEILCGLKTYDCRSYDTNKRGTIALVDSHKNQIIGLIDLIGTHRISVEEYCAWHCTGKYKDCTYNLADFEGKDYFAYDFNKPQRLAKPITINRDKSKHVWIEIDESVLTDISFQDTLF